MDYDEEDNTDVGYAAYGNALPDLVEEDASAKKMKPTPIEEQIATDEQGRRRFHGAFTGGFSAGFFNTAGSRDGWTPKSFKSSRSKKFEGSSGGQRPEDFMDDEDMGEFGFAPQKLQTSAKFNKQAGEEDAAKKKRKHQAESSGPIPGEPVLDLFIKPAQDTIGVRLLREMGWKPGQGVGPRLSRKHKKKNIQSTKRLFGPSLAPGPSSRPDESSSDSDGEEVDPLYKDYLFAPDDIPNFVAKPKENMFGIGYKGLERGNVLGGGSISSSGHINLFEPPQMQQGFSRGGRGAGARGRGGRGGRGQKLKIGGQAFGVGVYEEDDEDIYQREDLSRYDFALGDDENADNEQAKKKRDRKSRWDDSVPAEVADLLEGFSIATRSSSVLQKSFDPPELPRGFKPRGGAQKSRFDSLPTDKMATTNPTPDQRRQAISEVPPEPKTVEEQTESEEQIRKLLAENFDKAKASMLDGTFKPFARDEEKQKRYEKYLVCVKNGRKDALPILQPKTMTEWERDRERVEFERAAMLFKPMSFSMSSRFVSAGASEDQRETKLEEVEKPLSETEKAVRMKLFGKLTREVVDWHPAKILSVRFNVKAPYDGSVVGSAPSSSNNSGSKAKFDLFGRLNQAPPPAAQSKTLAVTDETNDKDKGGEEKENNADRNEGAPKVVPDKVIVPLKKPVIENEREEEVVAEKPPPDLFKSIFLDSDESSDDDKEESEKEQEKKSVNPPPKPKPNSNPMAGAKNVLRNPAPAKGIFANIDFDKLNAKKKNKPQPPVVNPESSSKAEKPKESNPGRMSAKDFFDNDKDKMEEEDHQFGPAKPKISVQKSSRTSSDNDSDSDSDSNEWVEKSSSKKKKSKKSKKKHHKKKSKKSKSKKSSKKHKRSRYSDSSSDSD